MKMFDRILVMVTIVTIILFFAINKFYKNTKIDIDSLNKEYTKLKEENQNIDIEIKTKSDLIEELKNSSKVMEYEKWKQRNEEVQKLF